MSWNCRCSICCPQLTLETLCHFGVLVIYEISFQRHRLWLCISPFWKYLCTGRFENSVLTVTSYATCIGHDTAASYRLGCCAQWFRVSLIILESIMTWNWYLIVCYVIKERCGCYDCRLLFVENVMENMSVLITQDWTRSRLENSFWRT